MKSRWISIPLLVCSALLFAACGGRQATGDEPEPVTALGPIILVPAAPPEYMRIDNRSIPVIGFVAMGIANSIADKGKSAGFNDEYGDYRDKAGDKLTEALKRELQAQGYTVTIANPADVKRDENGKLDYKPFPLGSLVASAIYDSMGMYSGRTSMKYVPVVGASFYVVRTDASKYGYEDIYSQYYMYGGWASEDGNGSLLADAKYSFGSFYDVMSQSELVREGYDQGLAKMAKFMVQDLYAQYKPAVVAKPAALKTTGSTAAAKTTTSSASTAAPAKSKSAKKKKTAAKAPAAQ